MSGIIDNSDFGDPSLDFTHGDVEVVNISRGSCGADFYCTDTTKSYWKK